MEKLHLLVALLLALSCNLDNLVVSTSYGTRKINISFASNLLIAIITGSATLAAMLAGKFISGLIHPWYANYIGAMLIVFSGIWIFINETLRTSEHDAPTKYIDCHGSVSLKEGIFLGFALTANNLVNSLGAGMTGLSPVLTPAFVFVFSLTAIWLGLKIGYGCVSRLPGSLAGPVSGVLLILIGLFEMYY